MTQKFFVNGRWMTKDQAIKARGLDKKEAQVAEQPKTQELTNDELDQLKAECDQKGIKYHHKAGEKKLRELLNNVEKDV